jgi:hypothetical protein
VPERDANHQSMNSDEGNPANWFPKPERDANQLALGGRRPLRTRILYPSSTWPCRHTRTAPFWHPWHIGAAVARLRMRYLVWRGY